jgi:hypothetical protein
MSSYERKVIGILAALVVVLLAARICLNADRKVDLAVSESVAERRPS